MGPAAPGWGRPGKADTQNCVDENPGDIGILGVGEGYIIGKTMLDIVLQACGVYGIAV